MGFCFNHAVLPLAGVFGAAGACSTGVCVVASDAAVELSASVSSKQFVMQFLCMHVL